MRRKDNLVTVTDKLLKNRVFLFLLSFCFALLLFFNVNQNLNFVMLENVVEYIDNDIKLEIEKDDETQIVEGNPNVTSFRISGNKADIERFKSEKPIRAKIDVRGHFGEKITIPIQHQTTKNYNVVIMPQPKEVVVNVFKKATVEKEIQIISTNPGTGFRVKTPPVILDAKNNEIKTIAVSGIEGQIQKIQRIEFRVTLQSGEGEKQEKIEPTFLDESGNVVQIKTQEYTVKYTIEKVI